MFFFNLCKKYKNKMCEDNAFDKTYSLSKILIITDLHHDVPLETLQLIEPLNYDACILLGDIRPSNLRRIKTLVPSEKLFGILGNHDESDLLERYEIKQLGTKEPTIIQNGDTQLSVMGLSGSYRYKKCNQCMITHEESLELCKNISDNFDLFVSHDYPVDFYDPERLDDAHPGLKGINYLLDSENHPEIMLHGHGHWDSKKYIKDLMVTLWYLQSMDVL